MKTKKLAILLATILILTACKSATNDSSSQALVITQATELTSSNNANAQTTNPQPDPKRVAHGEEILKAFNNREYLTMLQTAANEIDVEFFNPPIEETSKPKTYSGSDAPILRYTPFFVEFSHYIDSIVSKDELMDWYEKYDSTGHGDKISENPNLYTFYKDFGFTWEDVKDLALQHTKYSIENDYHRDSYFLESEYQLIFNGTEEEINQYFAFKMGIAIEDRSYPVIWNYENDLSEYVKAGITPHLVEKTLLWCHMEFTEDFANGMQNKFDTYNKLCIDVYESYKKGERVFDIEKWIDENL